MQMTPRFKPAFSRANAYLEQIIAQSRDSGHYLLPPVRTLASKAGVSHATMAKCVRELEAKGQLHIRNRSGIALTAPADLPDSAVRGQQRHSETVSSSDSVQEWIVRDYVLGAVSRSNRLPTINELTIRYAVSYRTIRHALNSLVLQGSLSRKGKQFYRATAQSPKPSTRIMLILAHADVGLLAEYSPRSDELWRQLEYEGPRSGIDLQICDYQRFLASLSSLGDIAGFLVWTPAFDALALRTLLEKLSALQRPVAVLDETKKLDFNSLCRDFVSNKRIAFFFMAMGEQSGTDVGNFLLGQGHRDMAFFASTVKDPCYGPRYQGFRRAVEENTGYSSKTLLFQGTEESYDTIKLSLLRKEQPYKNLYARLTFYNQTVLDLLGETSSLFMVQDAYRPVRTLYLKKLMKTQFERALENSELTAWVCCNDELAFLALDFLAENRVDVPGRISVIGFDNRIEAFAKGLTSYSFDVPQLVAAMIEHVMWSGRDEKRKTNTVREVPGHVVPRWTSRSRTES